MHSILSRLCVEHGRMKILLTSLEAMLESLDRGEKEALLTLQDIVEYMVEYPDLYHHPLEDSIFQRLQSHDNDARFAINQLREEHSELRVLAERFLNLLLAALNDQAVSGQQIRDSGRRYLKLQLDHMSQEEYTVFPWANRELDARDWEAIETQICLQPDPVFDESDNIRFDSLRRVLNSTLVQ